MAKLIEGVDFYLNKQGLMVLTERYLSERGYCCKNGCKHCPYGYKKIKRRIPLEKDE